MARSRAGRYSGYTGDCRIVHVERFPHTDAWCTRHGAWIVQCEVCDRLFHSKRPHTKYCSTACSQKAYRNRMNGVQDEKLRQQALAGIVEPHSINFGDV